MTRAERVEQVNALKREGLNGLQIAARLGIGNRFVSELLNDPEGLEARKRKLRAGGTCADCGAPTVYKVGGPCKRCLRCQKAATHDSRRWTRESIVEWIRAFHAEHGFVPPSSVQVRRAEFPDAPGTTATGREFGPDPWRAAVRAAGFEPYRDAPGMGHKLGADHPKIQETVRLRAAGWTQGEIAHHHGVTQSAIQQRLTRYGEVSA